TAPTRLPWRVSTRARVVTTSTSTVRLSRSDSTVPKSTDGLRSSRNQAVIARSSRNSRRYGVSIRAVTFQSMCRTSSPYSYSRRSAKSTPLPRNRLRESPCNRPSRRRTTVQSRRWRTRSGAGGDAIIRTQRYDRGRDPVDDGGEDAVRADVVRKGLEREHQSMTEHVEREVEHVLGQGVVA